MNSSTWTTRNDAVEALEAMLAQADTTLAGRPVTDAYDVDAIADEVLTATGHGTTYRYVLADIEADAFGTIGAPPAR